MLKSPSRNIVIVNDIVIDYYSHLLGCMCIFVIHVFTPDLNILDESKYTHLMMINII